MTLAPLVWWLALGGAAAEEPVPAAPEGTVEVLGEPAPEALPEAEPAGLVARVARLEAELEALRAERAEATPDVPAAAQAPAGATASAGDVVVPHGVIWQEAVAFGGDLVVNGKVRGAATAFGGDVRVMEGGIVEGDAVAFGGRVEVAPGGIVGGNQIGTASASAPAEASRISAAFAWAYDRLVALLTIGGTGVLVVALFPARVNRVAQRLEARPIRSFFLGSAGGLSLGVAVLMFAVTVIGLPVSVALLGVLAFGALLGFVGLSQAVGDRLPTRKQEHGRWLAFLGGCVAVGFVSSLPWFGALFVLAAGAAGLGAALSSRLGTR